MNWILKYLIAGLAVAASLAVMIGCTDTHRSLRTEQHAIDFVANAPLVVKTRNGAVQVIGDPALREIEIEATITAGGHSARHADERLADTRLDIIRDTSGTLTIEANFPSPRRSRDSAEITVRLPLVPDVEQTDSHYDISTSNGRVTIENLTGQLHVTTSNGRIIARKCKGDAQFNTSNGRILVEGHSGELTAETSNGRVSITDHGGPATVRTSNGRITLSLLPDVAGPIDLQTQNGSVTVEVGPAFLGKVSLETSNSTLSIEDGASIISARDMKRRSGTITLTDDGPTSRIRTSNGSITFRTR